MAYTPPAPTSDCDACNAPGFYLNAAALYLNSAASDSDYDGDWDFGARVGVGFERPDGLFYEIEGFWYEGEGDDSSDPFVQYDSEIYAIDFLIGDNLHCGEACLDLAFGLRYASFELTGTRNEPDPQTPPPGFNGTRTLADFDGWGPTVQLEGTRSLGGPWSLYGELQQSILFGDIKVDEKISRERDALAFVTEIAGGVQYDLAAMMGGVSGAHVRLGGEGQYWVIDGNDFGLYGAALSVGFTF
ncbi:MAG: hypothetical protein HKN82_06060 [Akkermansiaceae bacterium]|nr:hypothetical protein [Akkermansiaceae bacterium]NNM30664.1 hypothetical protein [Akkermansiaceae bacterium]